MILVVGDFMVDEYVHVTIDRISPEAPVPIMRECRRELKPGGAGNVAANIASLGGIAKLLTVIGPVEKWWYDEMHLPFMGWLTDNTRVVTRKTRFVADRGQQVARLDCETTSPISESSEDRLLAACSFAGVNVIVLSDYQKGVVTKRVAETLISIAREKKIPVIVDSKNSDMNWFDGATIWTPNDHEYREALTFPQVDAILMTMGAKGVRIMREGSRNIDVPAVECHAVADVTGAGDTVVAALAVWIANHGLDDLEGAARFANHAASIAVTKRGTAMVYREEIVT